MPFRQIDAANAKTKTVTEGGLEIEIHAENDQKSQAFGTPIGIAYHWTAGSYTQAFDGYNFCIAFDAAKKEAVVVRTLTWKQKPKHLWGYNTGMVGISFCAMADGVMLSEARMKAVKWPVTPEMIEAAAVLTAEICAWKKIDPCGKITLDHKTVTHNELIATGGKIEVPTILDHAYMAKKCGYYPERWDVHAYYPKLVTRSQTIFRELKGAPMPGGGRRQFEFKALLQ